jgi:hypothetical protein
MKEDAVRELAQLIQVFSGCCHVYLDVALVKYYGKVHIAIIGVRIGYTEGAQALAGFTAARGAIMLAQRASSIASMC